MHGGGGGGYATSYETHSNVGSHHITYPPMAYANAHGGFGGQSSVAVGGVGSAPASYYAPEYGATYYGGEWGSAAQEQSGWVGGAGRSSDDAIEEVCAHNVICSLSLSAQTVRRPAKC